MATVAIVGAGPAGASAGYRLASERPRGHPARPGRVPPSEDLRRLDHPGGDQGPRRIGPPPRRARGGGGGAAREHRCQPPRRPERRHERGRRTRRRPTAFPGWSSTTSSSGGRCGRAAGSRGETSATWPRERRESLEEFDHVVDARGVYAGVANCVALRGYWTVDVEGLEPGLGFDGAHLRRRDVPARVRVDLPGGAGGRAGALQRGRGDVEGRQPGPGANRGRLLPRGSSAENPTMRALSARARRRPRPGATPWRWPTAETGWSRAGSSRSATPPTSPTP